MEAILAAIDTALEALSKGTTMNDTDMFEVFGDFDPSAHEAEAKERWGDQDAFAESASRTARYTKDDWKAIKAESEAIGTGLGASLASGATPGDPEVQALVERHRLQIDQRFYPCSKEMHANLGDMYVADPRFAATYERIQPGLARFVRDAIRMSAGMPPATD
jgi:MerR family transcriptional regulator, thiopeptide resistance regulator